MNIHPGVHIIMVEDDEGHALLIRRNLERAGISNKITHFTDGQKALDYFLSPEGWLKEQEPTLLLLDLNLPVLDGYGVLQKLKADERTQAVPIIILTTTDNPREVNRCYEMGCNVYITKPVEYDSFSDSIRKLGLMLAVVKCPTPPHH